jgi:hypothetical protein
MVPTDIRYDGAMSELGQSRHSDRAAVTSGLPLINGHFQSPLASLKGANNDLLRCKKKRAFSPSVGVGHSGYGAQVKEAVLCSRLLGRWCGLAIGARRVATPHSALAKDVLMVAGSASRISMSWIWAIASASATFGTRLNEIVMVGSSLTPGTVALWLSTSTVA